MGAQVWIRFSPIQAGGADVGRQWPAAQGEIPRWNVVDGRRGAVGYAAARPFI